MKKHQIAFLLSLALGTMSAQASTMNAGSGQDIKVLGLFKNMAVLSINDHRTVLRVGDNSHRNMRLLSANSEKAVFNIHGRRVVMAMSETGAIQTNLPTGGGSAQLISNGGLYSVLGTINGQLANFVVDTGATYVTMSPQQADALHLDYRRGARKIMMNTANGKTTAHVFNVKAIRIGGIELHNVDAAVMNNLSSPKILLGMSFLKQVNMKHGTGMMVLSQDI